jgi:large subunit ribosomal protein L18e
MKRTGPTKEKTRKIISLLKKEGKTKDLWKEVAKRINAPRRKRININLWKLEKLSMKFQNKTFLVTGKVLAKGEITKAINVAALEFSEKAKEKINNAKGKTFGLEEATKMKASELMLVK